MKKVNSQKKRKLLIPIGDFKSSNEGNIVRHKAQLAAKGCSQKYCMVKTMMKRFLLWWNEIQHIMRYLKDASSNRLRLKFN